jgi:hypothetical protein
MSLIRNWDNFWFSNTSPSPVCLFRILYGLITLSYGILWMPRYLIWFGQHSIISINTVQKWCEEGLSILLWYDPSDTFITVFFGVYILATVCLIIGFHTRLSNCIVFVLLASFMFRDPFILDAGDRLLLKLAFLLIFTPAGAMYSVDGLINKKRSTALKSHDRVGQRLLQLQMVSVYWQAFWLKLYGHTWLDGTAVYYALHMKDFVRFSIPYLFDHLWALKLLCWGTMLVEFLLWSLIWIRKFRYWILLAGLLLHAGFEWSLNIPLLQYIMVAMYITFIDSDDVERFVDRFKNRLVVISQQVMPGKNQVVS